MGTLTPVGSLAEFRAIEQSRGVHPIVAVPAHPAAPVLTYSAKEKFGAGSGISRPSCR